MREAAWEAREPRRQALGLDCAMGRRIGESAAISRTSRAFVICIVIASVLAATLWAAGPSRAEENAQPTAFNSRVAFDVYAVTGEERREGRLFVGRTPSEQPLTIPPCKWWYVEPRSPVNIEQVLQEVEAQRIPGLTLTDATDADVQRMEKLTALEVLYLPNAQVTAAGLEHLKGLTNLQLLSLRDTRITDAGLEHLKGLTALRGLHLERNAGRGHGP